MLAKALTVSYTTVRANTSSEGAVRSFLVQTVLFLVGLAVLLRGVDILVTSMTPWRSYQDPRARMVWDGTYDGTRLVLLGDSLFCSFYVDSLEDTLWARLEARTGQRVFPGALNGAKPSDVLAAAIHVSREWPTGTTVFIDVSPTRFVVTQVEDPPMGNYPDTFFAQYGIDVETGGVLRHFQGRLYQLLNPFFAVRTRSSLANMVDQRDYRRPFGHLVWSEKREYAMARFALFERNLVLGASPQPLRWLRDMKKLLEDARMHPVFVLTPLNEALVRRFARVHSSESLLTYLGGIGVSVRQYLDENGAAFIDLSGRLTADCFADLVHTNTCGDDLIAAGLADWLNHRAHH
jgi:hypothetical protein